jgi:hypothetical protein
MANKKPNQTRDGLELPEVLAASQVAVASAAVSPETKICKNCLAWKPNRTEASPFMGGCARSGQTTLHYGDTAYKLMTTDLQSCSMFEKS